MKTHKKRPEIINRKAYHDYFIDDTLECGISLHGNEVKSIINGKVNINETWVGIQNNNLIINNMFISRYETANIFDVDERRERQLLAHKREIFRLKEFTSQKGFTLIPLKVYFSGSKCKILIGIARGKHNYDKRNSLKEKQMKRDIDRSLKNH